MVATVEWFVGADLKVGPYAKVGPYGKVGPQDNIENSSDSRVCPGRLDKRAIELAHRRAPKQPKGSNDIGSENLDGAGNARASGGAKCPRVGAADEHGSGAKADGLDDVGTAPDAAAHQDLDASVDGIEDLRQCAKARRHAVQLPPAMIGHDNRVRSRVDRAPCIVTGVDAFHDDRTLPGIAHPAEVLPRHDRALEQDADIAAGHRADVGQ